MILKLFGAVMIIVGCGGFGCYIVASQQRQIQDIKQLLAALEYIACELNYHLTPLPELCRRVSQHCTGRIQYVFITLASELDRRLSPNVSRCMETTLNNLEYIPPITKKCLQLLGRSLGYFELDGQLKGIESVRIECLHYLQQYSENAKSRMRSYQTLALCAGAALAILFV